jgi:hypothetical protein
VTLNPSLFSSELDDWNTPEVVLERVRQVAPIGLDPCSNAQSIVGALFEWRLARGEDGLVRSWGGFGLVFVNPPYGRALARWAEKIRREAESGVEIVVLVPHRTDTQWYSHLAPAVRAKCEWRGRLHHPRGVADSRQASLFGGAPERVEVDEGPAAFPSVVLYCGPKVERFAAAFETAGEVWKR